MSGIVIIAILAMVTFCYETKCIYLVHAASYPRTEQLILEEDDGT